MINLNKERKMNDLQKKLYQHIFILEVSDLKWNERDFEVE
jgi:hypothetical protein